MSSTGKIMSLYADKEKSIPIFPRTKVKAISDDNGVGLDAILDGMSTELDNAIDRLSEVAIEYQAIISTTWTGDAAPYTQEIAVAGLLEDDDPITDVIVSDDYTTSQLQLEEWAKIYRIEIAEDKLIAYANEPTTISLNIQMVVSRDKVIETGGTGGASVIVGTTQPENPEIGDMWYDSGDTSVAYIDELPTEDSTNFVTSGGVFEALSGKISIVKLWENASPESECGAQTIQLDVSEYVGFEAQFYVWGNAMVTIRCYRAPQLSTGRNLAMLYASSVLGDLGNERFGTRRIIFYDDRFEIEDCWDNTNAIQNSHLVPFRFYGIKGVK